MKHQVCLRWQQWLACVRINRLYHTEWLRFDSILGTNSTVTIDGKTKPKWTLVLETQTTYNTESRMDRGVVVCGVFDTDEVYLPSHYLGCHSPDVLPVHARRLIGSYESFKTFSWGVYSPDIVRIVSVVWSTTEKWLTQRMKLGFLHITFSIWIHEAVYLKERNSCMIWVHLCLQLLPSNKCKSHNIQ